VEREVDFAHPARTEFFDDAVGADHLAGERRGLPLGERARGLARGRRLHEVRRLLVHNQRLDLAAQLFVAGARLREEGRALRGRALKRRLKDVVNLPVAFAVHRAQTL
jgi:hypothetical protein